MPITAYVCRLLTVTGLLWGSYRSFKVLKNWDPQKGNALLRLWVVMSFQALYEQWLELFMDWMPLYYEIKCGLLIWLLFPESNAPLVLFDSLVTPAVEFMKSMYNRRVSPTIYGAIIKLSVRVQHILFLLVVDGLRTRDLEKWEKNLRQQHQVYIDEMEDRVQRGTGQS